MTHSSDAAGHPEGPVSVDIETVFERIDDGVFAVDTEDRFTFLNSRAEELLDVAAATVVGEDLWEVFPDAIGTAFEANYRQAMETKEPVSFEAHYDPLDTWFEVRLYPDEEGLSAYFRDVTDRKARERELRQYEAIVENMDDVAFIVDEDRRLAYANDAAVSYPGITREQIIDTPIMALTEQLVADNEDTGRFETALDRVLDPDETAEFPLSVELELDLPGGRKIGDYQLSPIDSEVVSGAVVISRDVTDRHDREQELERFEETINAVDDVVYALDDEGCFDLVNDAVTDLTGYDREQLLGEHVEIIKDQATVEAAEDALRSLLGGEAAETTFEFPLQPADGPEIPCEDHMTVVYDDDGSFAGTAGVIRDISAQKERQRKLSGLVETTRKLMDATDQQAVAELTLAAARDILGFELSTVRLYDEMSDTLVPAASTGAVDERMGERPVYPVGEGPAGEAFETGDLLVYGDVREIDDEIDRSPMRSVIYVPIGEYGVLVLGATDPDSLGDLDRQVAEVLATSAATACNRAEREVELREERAFIDGLLDSIPDIMYALDGTSSLLRWNDRLETVTGYTDAEIQDLDPFDLIADDHVDRITGAVQTVFAGERDRIEADLVTKDGKRIPYEFTGAPVTDENGTVTGLVGIARDISERLERERELKRQNDRLERFASTVSHDLRNPLRMANSNLEMARHDFESPLLDDVAEAHDRMEELIEDLLALARQGQTVDETEAVHLGTVAREAFEHVDAPEATLELDADWQLQADRQRLLQVFENLFRNAVEHASPDVSLQVGTTISGFYVADDGPGIPDDEREAVFEYGYTTTETGTGLGLAIVEEALTAHGWAVSLGESETGGVRFDIDLC